MRIYSFMKRESSVAIGPLSSFEYNKP